MNSGWLAGLVATGCVVVVAFILVEAFETLVLPRRIERPLRLVAAFYQGTWGLWRRLALLVPSPHRDNFLSIFGPLSLLLLLSLWAVGLILAFGTFQWAIRSPVSAPEGSPTLGTYLYLSATTFITLGFGDVAPRTDLARLITDIEAGVGFGFLAIIIGYFPVLYGAFSRREVDIALLDARASSPPSAGALLQRVAFDPELADLQDTLRAYERWAAELMESHLSYPVLMWYRSQHDRQSWLSALTTVLDTCAVIIAAVPEKRVTWQAKMTFAMARHAAVDLSHVFATPPAPPVPARLTPEGWAELHRLLAQAGLELKPEAESWNRLTELRELYEPYVHTLTRAVELRLPPWLPDPDLPDNWQTSAWGDDHFFAMQAVEPKTAGRANSSNFPR